MSLLGDGFLQSLMGKKPKLEPRPIYLGAWLDLFDVDVTKAAKAAGVTQGYVSNIIANRKPNVNVLILLSISEMLGITVNDMYQRPPTAEQTAAMAGLSPQARESLIALKKRKAG